MGWAGGWLGSGGILQPGQLSMAAATAGWSPGRTSSSACWLLICISLHRALGNRSVCVTPTQRFKLLPPQWEMQGGDVKIWATSSRRPCLSRGLDQVISRGPTSTLLWFCENLTNLKLDWLLTEKVHILQCQWVCLPLSDCVDSPSTFFVQSSHCSVEQWTQWNCTSHTKAKTA